jgi:hypothetical protein
MRCPWNCKLVSRTLWKNKRRCSGPRWLARGESSAHRHMRALFPPWGRLHGLHRASSSWMPRETLGPVCRVRRRRHLGVDRHLTEDIVLAILGRPIWQLETGTMLCCWTATQSLASRALCLSRRMLHGRHLPWVRQDPASYSLNPLGHKRGGTLVRDILETRSSYVGVSFRDVALKPCATSPHHFWEDVGQGIVYHQVFWRVCCLPLGDVSCWVRKVVTFLAMFSTRPASY